MRTVSSDEVASDELARVGLPECVQPDFRNLWVVVGRAMAGGR